tara:strand:- start:260 stop:568 length:309 start_codon:yes stop_codon:yes gene_type:complete
MIKLIATLSILVLAISTSLIKNSTKDIEDQIYSVNENIISLEKRSHNAKLEFDYLSSSEKLLEYQELYFENLLIKKSLKDLKTLKISEDQLIIDNLRIIKEK